jgi:hypothetical protein
MSKDILISSGLINTGSMTVYLRVISTLSVQANDTARSRSIEIKECSFWMCRCLFMARIYYLFFRTSGVL